MARRFWSLSAAIAALAGGALFFALHGTAGTAPAVPATAPSDERATHAWPGYQYSPAHNAVFDGTLRTNWLTRLGDRINGGLAVVDGTVYAVSFDDSLYALDEGSGKVRWSARAGNVLMSTPVVTAGGLVIVGSGKDGFLKPNDADSQVWGRPAGDDFYAFATDDGHAVWKFHTDGENMPSPALRGDTLVFANGDAHAYAIDASTSRLRWRVDLPGVATMASTTIDGDAAFVSTCHNAPYFCETRAIDVETGKTLWSNPHGGSDCTPTVYRGTVFVNSTNVENAPYTPGGYVTVAAIDAHTGHTKWTRRFERAPFTYIASSERQIAGTAHGGMLYQSIGNLQRVVAMDAAHRKNTLDRAYLGQCEDESGRQRRARVFRRHGRHFLRGGPAQRTHPAHRFVSSAVFGFVAGHRRRHAVRGGRPDGFGHAAGHVVSPAAFGRFCP